MSTHIILNKNVKRGRIILDVEEIMLSEVDHSLTEIFSIVLFLNRSLRLTMDFVVHGTVFHEIAEFFFP